MFHDVCFTPASRSFENNLKTYKLLAHRKPESELPHVSWFTASKTIRFPHKWPLTGVISLETVNPKHYNHTSADQNSGGKTFSMSSIAPSISLQVHFVFMQPGPFTHMLHVQHDILVTHQKCKNRKNLVFSFRLMDSKQQKTCFSLICQNVLKCLPKIFGKHLIAIIKFELNIFPHYYVCM